MKTGLGCKKRSQTDQNQYYERKETGFQAEI
jgi:hypothetical protein